MGKVHIIVEVDIPDGDANIALVWMASVLDTAFWKKNPAPRPPGMMPWETDWRDRVPVPPNEHPYRPRTISAKKIK